ncbi:PXMP2/4 family protein 4 [Nymphaea thermarum]|nr:PXMP2/4 family protein 4 [Nymphaea thermarum]
MDILGLGFGWNGPFPPRRFRCPRAEGGSSLDSDAPTAKNGGTGWSFRFPLGPSATSSSLALTGDTIAQFIERSKIKRREPLAHERNPNKDFKLDFLCHHDWLRALRMASYGFLLYGPGSYAWYQLLDHYMPKQTLVTLSAKVVLNQIILGPSVIAVVFAWNSLWVGKLSELPIKYQKDALPTLLNGFKFWIPASILNFGVVPLQARVAFMSACSIFWNFYLSTTMSKQA